jgi:hypothetical protein
MRVIGAVIGVVGFYASWVIFLYALLSKAGLEGLDLVEMALQPAGLWNLILLLNETGWYSIQDITPSGAFLWAFWAIEAVVVIGGVVLMAPLSIEGEVFCEDCSKWAETTGTLSLQLPAESTVLTYLAQGQLEGLDQLPWTDEFPQIRVELIACESCEKTRAYQISRVSLTTDKEGKTSESALEMTGKLLLKPSEYVGLVELEPSARALAASQVAAPPEDEVAQELA